MKKITLVGLVFFLVLSGVVLAEQAGEGQKASPMQGMMQEMMKGEKTGEGGMGGMMQAMMSGEKGSEMIGQMGKMMDQCSAMMESMHPASGQTKEGEKK